MVSSWILFSSLLVGLLLLQSHRTTLSNATTQTWALLPSFIFNTYILTLGIRVQVLEFLSKARKLCTNEEKYSCFVSSSKPESRNMIQGLNHSGTSLYHSVFLVALVTLLHTLGLQQRLPSSDLLWMPSGNFPWDSPRQQCQGLFFSWKQPCVVPCHDSTSC